ncbi:hypothetical protein [Flavobacterium sp.]|jgi:hypothetical protein|uniref:hypothetical protein n=1 Tax=Flavobacterium sp. TaxID=239 RepID=UPI002A800F5D|nr:hypothetical protein [Flavobacterium sp.]
MKKSSTIIILFLSFNLFSQEENFFKCDKIKTQIIDKKLFDSLSNGKLIARFDRYINNIYKVVIDEKELYYVTKSTMKKIKRSIKKYKCEGVVIKKIDKLDETGIKIIRD